MGHGFHKKIFIVLILNLPVSYVFSQLNVSPWGHYDSVTFKNPRQVIDVDRVIKTHVELCEAVNSYRDERFCNRASDTEQAIEAKRRLAESILGRVMTKTSNQESSCETLQRLNADTHQVIRSTQQHIDSIEAEIEALKTEAFTNPPKFKDDKEQRRWYDGHIEKALRLEASAQAARDTLRFLRDGEGSPSNIALAEVTPLPSIENLLKDMCSKVEVTPSEVENSQVTKEVANADENWSSLTRAVVTVAFDQPIEHESEKIVQTRTDINQNVDQAREVAAGGLSKLTGGPTTYVQTDQGEQIPMPRRPPLIVNISQTVEALSRMRDARIVVGPTHENEPCVGANCPTPAPPTPDAPGGGGGNVVKPNDGPAYGGGTGQAPNTANNAGGTGGSEALGKTGGSDFNINASAFNLPSLYNNSNTSGSNGGYARGVDVTAGGIANMNSQYSRDYVSRNQQGSLQNNAASRNANGSNSDAGASGSRFANLQAAGRNPSSAGYAMSLGTTSDSADKKSANRDSAKTRSGNKLLRSSRDDKAAGLSKLLGAQSGSKLDQRDLKNRLAKMQKESQSNKAAFDPDKYVPKTEAERIALARAAGRMASFAKDKNWPNDISRSSEQSIFEIMLKGYKKHLQEKKL